MVSLNRRQVSVILSVLVSCVGSLDMFFADLDIVSWSLDSNGSVRRTCLLNRHGFVS